MSATDTLILLAEDNPTDALMVKRALGRASVRTELEVVEEPVLHRRCNSVL